MSGCTAASPTELAADPMTPLDPATAIESWHAHIYFDASTRNAAWVLREVIVTTLAGPMELGRFHEQPVGPHPMCGLPARVRAGALNLAALGD
jgi:Dopa 4,5-dioxygenase family